MRRPLVLSWFLLKELIRSFAIVAPLAVTLALYRLFFEYPGDVDYFAATGGFTLIMVGCITTLLLASGLNRAASYVLVGRLVQRSDLLGGVFLGALAVCALMALLYTLLVLAQAQVQLSPQHLGLIAPRWIALSLISIAASLHVTRLVSRGGSYLLSLLLLAGVATLYEQRILLYHTGLAWLARVIDALLGPVIINLSDPVTVLNPQRYLVGLMLGIVGAGALYWLATRLFQGRDLLWVE